MAYGECNPLGKKNFMGYRCLSIIQIQYRTEHEKISLHIKRTINVLAPLSNGPLKVDYSIERTTKVLASTSDGNQKSSFSMKWTRLLCRVGSRCLVTPDSWNEYGSGRCMDLLTWLICTPKNDLFGLKFSLFSEPTGLVWPREAYEISQNDALDDPNHLHPRIKI